MQDDTEFKVILHYKTNSRPARVQKTVSKTKIENKTNKTQTNKNLEVEVVTAQWLEWRGGPMAHFPF